MLVGFNPQHGETVTLPRSLCTQARPDGGHVIKNQHPVIQSTDGSRRQRDRGDGDRVGLRWEV